MQSNTIKYIEPTCNLINNIDIIAAKLWVALACSMMNFAFPVLNIPVEFMSMCTLSHDSCWMLNTACQNGAEQRVWVNVINPPALYH